MKPIIPSIIVIGVALTLAPGSGLGEPTEKKGTTPYVTHFVFRPVTSLDVLPLGTATLLEAVGTTQNMKGEKMLDKMSARCMALSVAAGDKKYIDGACVLADADGDKIFSTFDTRDLDKSVSTSMDVRGRLSLSFQGVQGMHSLVFKGFWTDTLSAKLPHFPMIFAIAEFQPTNWTANTSGVG